MENADDFYFEVLRQVRMDRWSAGRVVLAGDAAWCATPISGIGTTLAIVGAYVLAGELSKSTDPSEGFAAYERIMRPFVEEGQSVPKIMPRLLNPHSRIGVAMLRGALRVIDQPVVKGAAMKLFVRDSQKLELPEYGSPTGKTSSTP
ncbi:FAD-dependent monooxygenase [Chenggangzhangella methanolivorans]|uniref:FAD-dependent monooxygenase n=1 Tax=Chenggangzhangella methanolivorans TaxID=1437009 RepID=A0A9E6URB1_9HYPH|nr:FAD-dependent monooxygenase [Chenggangzhangella methanolivorans]QZO02075.1 FAD-dependent monooxygenase [Chenggangzhangella methanolivorans]